MSPAVKAKVLPPENDVFQLVMLVLSVYVLIVFIIQSVVPLSEETTEIFDFADSIICLFFLADFFIRLYRAPSKLVYMRWGWIDLISSIPILPIFYQLRWLRVIRLLRILRAFRSTHIIVSTLFKHRARAGLLTVLLISLLVAIFGAVAELDLETDRDSNIKTAEDALWWSFSTITTVACEKFPVTEAGRIVAVFIMISGVVLFGTISAYMSSVFLEPLQKKEESEVRELLTEMRVLREKIEQMERNQLRALGLTEIGS